MRDVLGKDELEKRNERRGWEEDGIGTCLVELVTEVYRVDVVTLEVGEHYDLQNTISTKK